LQATRSVAFRFQIRARASEAVVGLVLGRACAGRCTSVFVAALAAYARRRYATRAAATVRLRLVQLDSSRRRGPR